MLSVLPVISAVYYFRNHGPILSDFPLTPALSNEGRGRKFGNAASRQVLQTTLRVLLLSLLLIGVPLLLKLDVVVSQIKLMIGISDTESRPVDRDLCLDLSSFRSTLLSPSRQSYPSSLQHGIGTSNI